MLYDTQLGRDLILRETAKAICFTIPGFRSLGTTARTMQDRQVWLPKSQITWQRPEGQPQFGESAHIPGWLARQNNL